MADFNNTRINSTGFIKIPAGSESQRPASPAAGMIRLNTDENKVELYNGVEWGPNPPVGSAADLPATTAKEAFDDGLRGTSIWIKIGNNAYQMEYDPTDRFDTGENGWANYSSTVFGVNSGSIPNATFGSPSTIISAWNSNSTTSTSNDTIGQGELRIGREQSHAGGNSLGTVRCAAPLHTSLYYQLTDGVGGGADGADFGTGWQSGNYGFNIFNDNPYQNNGQGYWCIMHSGNPSDTNNSTNSRILDPGNLRSGNGSWTTNNYESWGTQLNDSFIPYLIWGTTDGFREYAFIRSWNVWLH